MTKEVKSILNIMYNSTNTIYLQIDKVQNLSKIKHVFFI